MFNWSLEFATFPSEWKIHKIRPIPKSGDKSLVSNYRPISLLCIVSKVLEKAVFNEVIQYVGPKLSKRQFGFIEGRSCLSQLLTSYAQVYSDLDNGARGVDALFFDFTKAFDSVPHNELLLKLWKIGVTGKLWQWFKEYLSNREHYVSVDDAGSSLLLVKSGVPQGSILGPLLFLIYIDDLPVRIANSECYLFADDVKIFKSIIESNSPQLLSSDLSSLNDWCDIWKLKLNERKCAHLCFSFSHRSTAMTEPAQYTVGDSVIVSAHEQKDLGVIVTDDLSWSCHYNKICKKAYLSLHLIKRALPASASVLLKKQLFISLVRSHFSYCSQLWKPLHVKDILSLERVQRRATKFILNDYVSDYKTRLRRLSFLPLSLWLDLRDVMFLVKCLQSKSDDSNFNIFDYIKFCSSVTRSSGVKLAIKYARTSTYRHFYFNRIVHIYNAICSVITLSDSYYTIQCKVTDYLWSYFNSHFNPHNTCTFHLICPCNSCHGLYLVL